MAVRSRTSLRVPVRQDHDDDDDDDSLPHDDDWTVIPPPSGSAPSKPSRIQPSSTGATSRSHRRRKSSPDLLDATTPNVPRRTSTRLVLASASSTTATPDHINPPHSKARLLPPRHATPTVTTTTTTTKSTPPISSFFLRGVSRESPDPLDTISPATATTDSKRFSGRTPSSVYGRPLPENPPTEATLRPEELSPSAINPSGIAKTSRFSTDVGALGNSTQPPAAHHPANHDPATLKPAVKEQRRSLRSHDGGSRARSELALYFPNYEQILSVEPPKPEFLSGNTSIRLIGDLKTPPLSDSAFTGPEADTPFGNPLLHLHNCETITLPEPTPTAIDTQSSPSNKKPSKEKEENEDPLDEAAYFRAHRRNERQEKQLRNIERDRAQHEKQQLDRLLDELQSTDWPRVMGIGTLTDADERKHYETKRGFFIKEISALIQKFKIWKEEEKRRKVEKEKLALQQQQEQAQSQSAESHQPPSRKRRRQNTRPSTATQDVDEETEQPNGEEEEEEEEEGEKDSSSGLSLSDALSPTETPDINDVDAAAARQLLQEARSATAGKKLKQATISFSGYGPKKKPKTDATSASIHKQEPSPPPLLPPPPPPDDKPFTSFYAKPHLRETALSTHRKGRVRFAFGHPIPEMEEREFELPSEILTPEAIHACRRKRRRLKRENKNSG